MERITNIEALKDRIIFLCTGIESGKELTNISLTREVIYDMMERYYIIQSMGPDGIIYKNDCIIAAKNDLGTEFTTNFNPNNIPIIYKAMDLYAAVHSISLEKLTESKIIEINKVIDDMISESTGNTDDEIEKAKGKIIEEKLIELKEKLIKLK